MRSASCQRCTSDDCVVNVHVRRVAVFGCRLLLFCVLLLQSKERSLREKCLQSAMYVRRLRGDVLRAAAAAKSASSEHKRLSTQSTEAHVRVVG